MQYGIGFFKSFSRLYHGRQLLPLDISRSHAPWQRIQNLASVPTKRDEGALKKCTFQQRQILAPSRLSSLSEKMHYYPGKINRHAKKMKKSSRSMKIDEMIDEKWHLHASPRVCTHLVLVPLLVEGARGRRVTAGRNLASVLAHLRKPVHLRRKFGEPQLYSSPKEERYQTASKMLCTKLKFES